MDGELLIMRGLGDVGLDALQLHGFHGGRLPLDLAFQALQQLALLDDDSVQLLELVFEVGEVGFQSLYAAIAVISHDLVLTRSGAKSSRGNRTPPRRSGGQLAVRSAGTRDQIGGHA